MKAEGSAGFSLVEVTLALGMIVFCALTLMALLPVGVAGNQQSIQQTAAANMASSMMSDLNNTAAGITSTLYALPKPAATATAISNHVLYLDDDGTRSGSLDATAGADARYRADISFIPSSQTQGATLVRILISWPAGANPDPTQTLKNITGTFEVISALNRN